MTSNDITVAGTFDIVNQIKKYDFARCLNFIIQRGKEMYSPHFIINSYQKRVYFQLLVYAIEDEIQLQKLHLDPRKGILLIGDSGLGKTSMMHLTKNFFIRKKQYAIKNCRALSNDFSHRGFEAILPLLQSGASLCLDNMGKETISKYYGNTCDTTYLIVEHFYERRFEQDAPKLHLITDLSPSEIQKRYGIGFRKMLQELCNVIVCD